MILNNILVVIEWGNEGVNTLPWFSGLIFNTKVDLSSSIHFRGHVSILGAQTWEMLKFQKKYPKMDVLKGFGGKNNDQIQAHFDTKRECKRCNFSWKMGEG